MKIDMCLMKSLIWCLTRRLCCIICLPSESFCTFHNSLRSSVSTVEGNTLKDTDQINFVRKAMNIGEWNGERLYTKIDTAQMGMALAELPYISLVAGVEGDVAL